MNLKSKIKDRFKGIKENVYRTALKQGRDPEAIEIVPVSKAFPLSTLQAAYKAGLKTFGENRVGEALEKIPELPDDIEWHFVGQLQSRKSKDAVPHFDLIHSVDRNSLVERLNRQAKKQDIPEVNILVQVDFTGKDKRGGVEQNNLMRLLEYISEHKKLRVKGLMTLPPYSSDPEDMRPYFKKLYRLGEKIKNRDIENCRMKYLSMGMTADYEIAIEEGSNMLRIGRGIFGERPTDD